jgi:hypothetical protein
MLRINHYPNEKKADLYENGKKVFQNTITDFEFEIDENNVLIARGTEVSTQSWELSSPAKAGQFFLVSKEQYNTIVNTVCEPIEIKSNDWLIITYQEK